MKAAVASAPSRLVVLLVVATIVGFGVSRRGLTKHRGFNPDEFEHLHFSWLTSEGRIAYRDYFDHHTPLLHLAFAQWLKKEDVQDEAAAIKAMEDGRTLMLGLTLLTLAAGALFVGRESTPAALTFVALLGSSPVFIAKSLEFRPDVPAMFCLLLALCFSASQRDRLAGLTCALALLFTPKSIFGIAGLLVSLVWTQRESSDGGLKRGVYFAQGASVPLLVMAAWLSRADALLPAIRFSLVEAARWSGPAPGPLVLDFLRTNAAMSALFVLSSAASMQQWRVASPLLRASLSMTAVGFAGVFLVTYPSHQFLLLTLPPCAVLISLAWDGLIRRRFGPTRPTIAAHLALAVVIVAMGLPEHVRAFARGNTAAVVALEQIARNTARDEQVLDGFIGYAPLRSHGTFFPFLHKDVRALRERLESPSLLQDLKVGRVFPKFALMNHYLQDGVEPAVWDFLDANYSTLADDRDVRVRLFDNGLGFWKDTAPRSLVPNGRREPHVLTLDGWSGPREVEGRLGRWLVSAEPAVLLIPVRETRPFDLSVDLTITEPLVLTIDINGLKITSDELSTGTQRHLFLVPDQAWRLGLNQVAFSSTGCGRRHCFVSSVQLLPTAVAPRRSPR